MTLDIPVLPEVDGDVRTFFGTNASEHVHGRSTRDLVVGFGGNDHMRGNAGNDIMDGSHGSDTLYGDRGRDILFGGTLEDRLYGGVGNDGMVGGRGEDVLFGGAGNDILIGSEGRDALRGGAGFDVFRFFSVKDSRPDARDVIKDFDPSHDWIDVSDIDANAHRGGNQKFEYIGSDAFSSAGELRLDDEVLYANIDGDGHAELAVAVPGLSSLRLVDLIL
jgi:serralysin